MTVTAEVLPRDRKVLAPWTPGGPGIVLLTGDGVGANKIARTGAPEPAVIASKQRCRRGIGGLKGRPGPGKPRAAGDAAIVPAPPEPPPGWE